MLGFFLMVWGILFGAVPVYVFLDSAGQGESDSSIFVVIIFVGVGIVIFALGVWNVFLFFRKKLIAKMGKGTVATFIDMQVGGVKNEENLYFIKYFFTDENNSRIHQKSPAIFRFQQAYYFKTLHHFKIKYSGRQAVIVEPLNFAKMSRLPLSEQAVFASFGDKKTAKKQPETMKTKVPKLVAGDSTAAFRKDLPTSRAFNQKDYFTCDYCGYVQDSAGRCLSCGARIKIKR